MSQSTGIRTTKQPSKIVGIQFSVLSPEEIRKSSVAEITTRDTYVNNKPVPGGLFDPRMGVLEPGFICPTDGLDYIQTPGYFGHIELARPVFYIQYLSQVIKVLNCVCYKCSKLLINKDIYKHALELPNKERWDFVYDKSTKVKRCGEENDDGCGCVQPSRIRKVDLATILAEIKGEETVVMKLTPEIVSRIFKRISDEDVDFMGFSSLFSRPEWMVCEVLAVPPPAVRPSVKHDAQQRSEDDLTHIIVDIIKMNNALSEKIRQNADQSMIDNWHTLLQYNVAALINNKIPSMVPVSQRSGRPMKSVSERLKGKQGRVRGNLMGKRVDFSARSVITGDPNISIRELGVPKPVAMNITYPITVNDRNIRFLTQLVRNGPLVYPGAKILQRATGEQISLRYVDRDSIVLHNGDVVHRHMLNGDHVLFNRQPTLHRMSMMCHRAKIMNEGNTFRMNVADTKPYNADYDGDEMNMHMPQDEESYAELRHLAAVPRQIISPASNSPIVGIFQDSLLSSFRITRPFVKFNIRDAMNLLMAHGRTNRSMFHAARTDGMRDISTFELMTQILPPLSIKYKNNSYDDDENTATSNNIVEIVNGVMKRGQLDKSVKKLLQIIFNDFGHEACADFIDDLQNVVTGYMVSKGFSVGISDLIADADTNAKIADSITRRKQTARDIIHQVLIGTFENNTGKPNVEEFESVINGLLNEARSEAGKVGKRSLDQENRFVVMTTAGSKGSDINIAQMISCLGQQNVDGKRIPYGFENRTLPHFSKFDDSPEARGFVESSFIQGLTPQETFFHAEAGRVGLIDTAVKTSQSGYIQRRLIKGMEDLKVEYDMTVRNSMGKIIQFQYGDDGVETTRVETQHLPLVRMSLEEVYAHFDTPSDDLEDELYTANFTKPALGRMRKQKDDLRARTSEFVDAIVATRDELVEGVFKGEISTRVNMPVHLERMLGTIQKQLHITGSTMVDITPLECYEQLDACKTALRRLGRSAPTKLFFALMDFYLCPMQLLVRYRFHKDAVTLVMRNVRTAFMKAIVSPGEMVGMIAAQSIGEPTTQMSCVAGEKMRILAVNRETGAARMVHEPVGAFCDARIAAHPDKTFGTGHANSVETLLEDDACDYYIAGVSATEQVTWNKISHVSRHPANGRLLRFRTCSGRQTITTASHSHLRRCGTTQTVKPVRGDQLRVGMRIPVCKSLAEDAAPSVVSGVHIGGRHVDLLEYANQAALGALLGTIAGGRDGEAALRGAAVEFEAAAVLRDVTQFLRRHEIAHDATGGSSESGRHAVSVHDADWLRFLGELMTVESCERMFDLIGGCDRAVISHFLRAFFDANSYCHLSRKFYSIRIISPDLQRLYDVAFLLAKMDIFAVIHRNQPSASSNELVVTSKYIEDYVRNIGTNLAANEAHIEEIRRYNGLNAHTLRETLDMVPGVGKLISFVAEQLGANTGKRNYRRWEKRAAIGRRTLRKYLAEFEASPVRSGVEAELGQLRQAAYSHVVWDKITSIEEVPAEEGEMVYDFTVPGNQTFMNDTGLIVHNTLNTFHSAGISSKSNVTRGVPRIEELLSLTKTPKNPSMTVHLKGDHAFDKLKAQQMKYLLEYTSLNDIVDTVTICFDPDRYNTLIEEDRELVTQFMEFERIAQECAEPVGDDGASVATSASASTAGTSATSATGAAEEEHSKWILRFELNRDSMLDRNITMDDVHFALQHGYKEELHCVYSDYNADKLIMRIRMKNIKAAGKISRRNAACRTNTACELDQSDDIYALKNIQDTLLHNVVLKGVHDIPNVNIRKTQNRAVAENGNYVGREKWVLDTVGTNLLDMLARDDIDTAQTYTNDIIELRDVLGIEAARQVLYDEFAEVIEFDGTYINYHHLSMLCDRMCCKHTMVSIYRHGITNDDIGPIAKASFEQTPEMFLRAARHGELDNLRGVSAAVMTGQRGNFGTSSFQVVLDMDEVSKLAARKIQREEASVEDELEAGLGGGGDDYCSMDAISRPDNVKLIGQSAMGAVEEDDYEMDF
jgi:DNA-directed RNA polymerase beta' subunit